MTVVHNHFSDFADGVFVDEVVRGAIAAVPGRFVVNEDLNFSALSGGLHGARILKAYGKGLLHHHGDAMAGAGFDHAAVVECVCVDEHCLWLGLLDHFIDGGKENVVWQAELRFIKLGQFAVSFGDSDDLYVRAGLDLLEKASDVSVDKAGDANAEWG
jgi:hypothetical protein